MAKIFIVSGLSGAGKDSIIDGLEDQGLDYAQVITTTTREPRSNESQKNPYYFVSKKEFEKMITNNELVEWANVYGNYYGNTKKAIKEALNKEKPVILKVDVQGAEELKKVFPESKTIFITVPSLETIQKRLEERGEDSPADIKKRLREIEKEMKDLDKWDYLVYNKQGELAKAIKEVKNIIKKEFNKK